MLWINCFWLGQSKVSSQKDKLGREWVGQGVLDFDIFKFVKSSLATLCVPSYDRIWEIGSFNSRPEKGFLSNVYSVLVLFAPTNGVRERHTLTSLKSYGEHAMHLRGNSLVIQVYKKTDIRSCIGGFWPLMFCKKMHHTVKSHCWKCGQESGSFLHTRFSNHFWKMIKKLEKWLV